MPMPRGNEIQSYLGASWRLMRGKPEALRQLDLSADGFWNSFYAFVVALPPLFVMWTSQATRIAPDGAAERFGIVLRLGLVELAIWVAQALLIAYVIYWIGARDRAIAFVVANNWGGALLAWGLLPLTLLVALVPATSGLGLLVMLVVQLVLSWRLNNAALGMGGAMATGAVASMVGITIIVGELLGALLAIPQPVPV